MYWRIDRSLCSPMLVNWIPWRFSSPQATAPPTSTATPETGNRKNSWTTSFGFRPLTSTCIPPWRRFQLTPRIVPASTLQDTCVRIGTRVYLRRFDNIRHSQSETHHGFGLLHSLILLRRLSCFIARMVIVVLRQPCSNSLIVHRGVGCFAAWQGYLKQPSFFARTSYAHAGPVATRQSDQAVTLPGSLWQAHSPLRGTFP